MNSDNQLANIYKKEQERRLILRNIIAEFLCNGSDENDPPSKLNQTQEWAELFSTNNTAQVQEEIFRESDWMLPQRTLPQRTLPQRTLPQRTLRRGC